LNREDALKLLRQYTKNENLVKHALAVEAAMRAYAKKYGEDEEKWSLVGLLHDFDYEMYPSRQDHPLKGAAILQSLGYPEDIIYAIKSHADYLGLERKSLMDKTLFAVDELAGFITAVALVRPSKKLSEVEVSSVKKKMKDKAFAKSVSRDDIINSAKDLGVDLDEHIDFVIKAMQGIAEELGL
jgi:putative nucleotidyltransferase with HDIG domain